MNHQERSYSSTVEHMLFMQMPQVHSGLLSEALESYVNQFRPGMNTFFRMIDTLPLRGLLGFFTLKNNAANMKKGGQHKIPFDFQLKCNCIIYRSFITLFLDYISLGCWKVMRERKQMAKQVS